MLIELLSSGAHAAQDQAARALWSLVGENPGAHDAIATAGQPAALVELLKQVRSPAISRLLLPSPAFSDLPLLVELLKQGIPAAKDYAIWSLSLSISEASQDVVAESGGVQPLIEQLADSRPGIKEQVMCMACSSMHGIHVHDVHLSREILGVLDLTEQILTKFGFNEYEVRRARTRTPTPT